ncbi:potassium voltage-gated channel subfamily H member 8 isoform X2 [Folsomia candida]|uniref:potassium voltage-gated channel subfamily H member 8 isoform X2 n=1 Tax=Folsomia candida TaxID=158441 RepID=UPI000B8F5C19|nr:potassium voltage-gated channel subfamily H member 8 isoform X2 [Folsomia candida]
MVARKGLLAPQNTFLDTIATRFDGTHSNFVLGNAQVATHPIVYCSDGFCELTGWSRAQIMQKGCACKFLFGQETREDQILEIAKSLELKSELKLEVMLYKKTGSPFLCLLDIVPITNEKREVVLFLASHKDITQIKRLHSGDDDDDDDDPTHPYGSDPNGNLDPEAPPANYGRRRSRAVLYQLSGHYMMKPPSGKQTKLKLQNTILQPTEAPLPEYKTAAIEQSRFVLSHYGSFKTCWDWLILVATFYVAVLVPYNAAFGGRNESSVPSVPDVVVEVLFIIDILFHFRTTIVNNKGEVVSNPTAIAISYAKGWFLLDLLAALPFDLLFAANIVKDVTGESQMHLLKLTRLIRLARLLQKMDRYSQFSAAILTLLMLSFTLAAHWLACIWYVIASIEVEHNGPDWTIGWMHALAEKLEVNVTQISNADKYVTALYFTCSSLTSVGFGNVAANTLPEKTFSIIVMLIGALMHAMVFGNVTAIVQRMYARRSQYQSKWRDLKDFLKLHQIPTELKQRVEDYFQTTWALNHGIDPHETLKGLPEELRGDMSMHLHKEILSLPIFEPAPHGCLKLLSLHIRTHFCAPGEYLTHKGDALHYIHYLSNGSMEVVQGDMVVAILGKGDLVGCDISHQLRGTGGCEGGQIIKSSSDIRALTYCDLKSIHIPGLIAVLRMYPEFETEFSHDIQHDLTYNLREGYEADSEADMAFSENGHTLPSLTLPSISEDEEAEEDEEEEESVRRRLLTGRSASFSSKSPLLPRDLAKTSSKRSLSECASTADVHSELISLAQEMRNLVKNLDKATTKAPPKLESLSWKSNPSLIKM